MIQFAPLFLLLALSLSWRRFVIIFRPEIDATMAKAPLTLVASAISISSLGLAIAGQGVVAGAVLILAAVLVARFLPKRITVSAITASCISLCAYLQLIERLS